MNADVIREKLNRVPFEHFEVIMSSGQRHLVKDPEIVHLLQSEVSIGDFPANSGALLSLEHVIELRQVEPQTSA